MSSSKIDLSTLKSFCDETGCLRFAERVVHQCWTWSFSHGLFPFSQLLTFELDSPYLVNGCCQESWESWKRDAGYFHVHHYFLDKYLSWWNLLALLIRTQILVFANWLLTVALQAPLSMGFSRQGYWSGLPCPPPEDLPNPRSNLRLFMSSALIGGFFLFFSNFYFYFILLYNALLVLPYIGMNQPWVYMSSQSWTPLPPPPHIISLDRRTFYH